MDVNGKDQKGMMENPIEDAKKVRWDACKLKDLELFLKIRHSDINP